MEKTGRLHHILDDGLDELAVSAHAGFPARFAVTIGVGAVFALMLPWRICLSWVVISAALELIAWFATRDQYLGRQVGWRTRLAHVTCLAAASGAWVSIGAMLWISGAIEGAVCGVLVWLSVIFFAQTNAYQSPMGFVVGGALPGAAVLAIVLLGPNPLHLRILPVGLVLVTALTFAAEGVTRMLAARRHLNETQLKVRQSAELWRMLFDQSPLPQAHFDTAGLYDLLRPHIEAGGSRLGDTLSENILDVSQGIGILKLKKANAATVDLYGVAGFEGGMEARHFDASFLSGFCSSLNDLKPDGSFPPFEAKVLRADGRAVDVCVHIRTVPEGANPWSNCIATFVDMTETRRAADAQQKALDEAEAANRAKDEFLATMSHEIRTPLNGVLGMVQAIQRDPLPKRQRERLAVIGQSGETLLTILNDILDLSKIEAGKLELERADFDLEPLVMCALETFKPSAEAKGLDFTVEVDADVRGAYRGDAVRVRRILYNLISNAIKFTNAGSVRVRVSRAQRGVQIAVADSGMGIDPDQIERLFDKFVQADSSTTRRFGGTGLGLSICRELCKAMGGEITAESEVGVGSCFNVALPLDRGADADAEKGQASAARLEFDARRLRLLAAEDNLVNQLVLKAILELEGLETVIVTNGQEAVAQWEQSDWDVILMDVQMPVMDGIAATREIRRREAANGRPATPIIALTANAMTHQTESYFAAGMNGFVAKPIEVAELFGAISAAIEDGTGALAAALRKTLAAGAAN